MTSLLLDTSVLVAAERHDRYLEEVLTGKQNAVVAAVSVAELMVGVHLSEGRHKQARSQFIGVILSELPVVPYTMKVAVSHARLMAATRGQGRPRGGHDLIIAATAEATDRLLVTADRGLTGLPGVKVRLVGRQGTSRG